MSHSAASRQSRSHRRTLAVSSALACAAFASASHAEPGTHGPSISTWDTRASSVQIGFRPGFLSGGHFDILSYNANFTATSGNLSSQFGVHYLNVRPGANQSVLQGMGATAMALFSIPVTPRYDNGQPKFAVGLYLGAAPAVLINGRASYLSIPIPLGIGLPWSPAKQVMITPWFEASPGVNLDTRVKDSATLDPTEIMQVNGSVVLDQSTVNKILNSAVDFKVKGTVGLRSGLDIAVRLGDSADLNINGMLGSLGGGFGGTFVGWLGAGITVRWDNVVPAVLPADKRLLNESCTDIEARYRSCQTTDGTITPVTPGVNTPPPAPAYSYPPASQYHAPPTYAPPQAPPAPSTTGTTGLPPIPPPLPAPSTQPAPGTATVPTSSFPQ
ncbi:MAG TPA: hypothetical protein VH062_06565 [Polyangiaceae bacterium]|jgi:hypothetical protein|nr:hypothetical protein [Polyangiaceae bacterium]